VIKYDCIYRKYEYKEFFMKPVTLCIISVFIFALSAGCGSGENLKDEKEPVKPERNVKAVILIEETFNDDVSYPGYTIIEDILADELQKDNIHPVSKDMAARSAKKTGINITDSMNGLVDPVIKDYLLAELRLDLLILGKIGVKSAAEPDAYHCTVALRGVSLKTGNVIAGMKFSGVYIAKNRQALTKLIADDIIKKGFSRKIVDAL
jgi:hypothetical protein